MLSIKWWCTGQELKEENHKIDIEIDSKILVLIFYEIINNYKWILIKAVLIDAKKHKYQEN